MLIELKHITTVTFDVCKFVEFQKLKLHQASEEVKNL